MPKDHLPEVGPNLQKLPPDRLHMDGGTQPRGRLDDDVVERYAEAMVADLWDFSKSSAPITVFSNSSTKTYWLADGFHRVAAAKKAGLACVEVDIRQGGKREAKWFSFGVNAEHGYARGKDDVARILKAIFEDTEWRAIPLREISRHTRIPFETVRRHHEKIAASDPVVQIDKPVTRTVNRGGTTYTMDVGAIGGKSKPPALLATSAVQLEVGSTETERDNVGDVADLGQVQAADDAKPAAKPVEQEYDSGTQALLKRYLSQNDFPSIVRHPARRVAAAARMFAPKTFAKVRQRMERQRQWLTDFLAALDEAAES